MPDRASPDCTQPASKPLLIISAGNTFPGLRESEGDFDDWIAAGLGQPTPALPQRRIDAQQPTPALPDPSEVAGVVVSGSHAMVTDRAPWSEHLAQWLVRCVDARVPVLGICYGHQLLAHALGGEVGVLAGGPEVGTHPIELASAAGDDPLMAGLPQRFAAQLVHYQSVPRPPPGAMLLARSGMDPHQAFRVGPCAWGVQFHPEFSASAMRGYLDHMQDSLADASALASRVTATPHASSLLGRFAALVAAAAP
ncbi:MAG: glutamine amidotransferase [Pseudomonadota bacterium]